MLSLKKFRNFKENSKPSTSNNNVENNSLNKKANEPNKGSIIQASHKSSTSHFLTSFFNNLFTFVINSSKSQR